MTPLPQPLTPNFRVFRCKRGSIKCSARLLALVGGMLLWSSMPRANGIEARSEVEALLDELPASGCDFRRNGQWHNGKEAREHLAMKHDYMLKQNPRLSTEQFITQGASGSSATQQPYEVRCSDSAKMPAANWWSRKLKALRESRHLRPPARE